MQDLKLDPAVKNTISAAGAGWVVGASMGAALESIRTLGHKPTRWQNVGRTSFFGGCVGATVLGVTAWKVLQSPVFFKAPVAGEPNCLENNKGFKHHK